MTAARLSLYSLLLLCVGLSAPLLAQDPVNVAAPGDQIRIWVRSGQRFTGRVAIIAHDSLWFESDVHRPALAFSRQEVARIARQVSGGGAITGMAIGAGIGIGIGLLPAVVGCDDCEFNVSAYSLAAAGVLGFGGAMIGVAAGALLAPTEWMESGWPRTGASVPGSGGWLGLTIPF